MPKPAARRIISWPMLPTPSSAERRAVEPARLRVLLLVPRAGAQLGDVVGHAAIEREDQREGQLGDRNRVLARAVRHVDAALRGRGDVDRVVAGAGADDQRQPAGVEHRRGDLGAAHDQHVGAASSGSPAVSAVVLQIRLVDDVAAGGLQPVDPALLELVGDQDFHAISCPSDQMNEQPVAELRLEPGRLGRHDAAGVGDRHQVVDGHRVQRERDRRLAASRPPARAPPCRGRRRRSRSACRCARRRSAAPARARRSCRRATSRPRRARAVLRRPRPQIDACTSWPSRYIETSPLPRGVGAAVGDRHALRAAPSRNCAGVAPAEILDGAVVGQDLHLVVGERDGDEGAGFAASPSPPQLGARPRRARGAMMAVGDVERRDRREGVDERSRSARRPPARSCAARRRRR